MILSRQRIHWGGSWCGRIIETRGITPKFAIGDFDSHKIDKL